LFDLSDKNNHRNTVYKAQKHRVWHETNKFTKFAIAVVIGTLVAVHGEQYLFAAVVLTGLIQIASTFQHKF
jgi:uncharacterized membrane protein